MKLSILFLVFAVAVMVTASEDIVKEDFQCVQGVKYKENECNGCQCAQEKLACTRKMCPQQPASQRNCEVGTAWNKDCKRCWCVEDWGSVCTVDCHH